MLTLSRDDLIEVLEALSAELGESDTPVELVVVGGAALILAFDARRGTVDIDTVGASPKVIAAARRIAENRNLPSDLLNNAASGYVHGGLTIGDILFKAPELVVRTVSNAQLLAMKLSAWRDDVDIEDSRLLIQKLMPPVDGAWASVEPYLLPGRELKARYAFEDLWEELHGTA